MKYVLLVGAGFSCNWGGWNATEVNDFLPTVPALRADRHVTQVLSHIAGTGGFEEALAEIEDEYDRSPTSENRAHLDILQSAITTMFLTMETAFKQRPSWDFCNLKQFKTAHFLSGFDAIFSLNQDLLPERHYHDLDLALNQPKKWYGWRRPGIQVLPDPSLTTNEPDKVTWTPRPPPFVLEPSHQPYFKLHGAWNWRSADKRQMLVMGGNKAASINKHPLLTWYHQQFESYMSEPDSRLMVIGYGFADPHINQTIERAADANPRMLLFLTDPRGRAILPKRIAEIDNAGVSRKPLRETLAGDEAERLKLMTFFT
ncbi:MAG TPA: SIR2 family protein [Stellaceae bacterium]|jgi:hypothetical protein|nr:SIR2 family protein [Stellaceae bacterium]